MHTLVLITFNKLFTILLPKGEGITILLYKIPGVVSWEVNCGDKNFLSVQLLYAVFIYKRKLAPHKLIKVEV